MAISQTANADNAPPSALTFPREIFAALQPRQYLLAHLAPLSKSKTSIRRPNGREPLEFRAPVINTNSLSHCNGSAVVRLGDTSVVCGVRGEILLASDVPNPPTISRNKEEEEDEDDVEELSSLGLIVPNIELATGSNPNHIPGSAPSNLAQSLTARLHRTLSSTRLIRARDLRIMHKPAMGEQEEDTEPEEEVKAYWTLYLDVLFLSLDGSGFDAAWLAVLAALKSTQLPRAWWDADLEVILCSDAVAEASRLDLRGLPIAASFAVFGEQTDEAAQQGNGASHLLADLDHFEDGICDEVVSVVVDYSKGSEKAIRSIEKRGGAAVDVETLKVVVGHAQARWEQCRNVLG